MNQATASPSIHRLHTLPGKALVWWTYCLICSGALSTMRKTSWKYKFCLANYANPCSTNPVTLFEKSYSGLRLQCIRRVRVFSKQQGHFTLALWHITSSSWLSLSRFLLNDACTARVFAVATRLDVRHTPVLCLNG